MHTGAGIVARSDPESEFMETEHKAAALRRAIELAAAPAVPATRSAVDATDAPDAAPPAAGEGSAS